MITPKDLLDIDKIKEIDILAKRECKTYRNISRRKKKIKKPDFKKNTSRYDVYIKSPKWKRIRSIYYKKNGRYCRICFTEKNIHLHHTYYSNLGKEKSDQLIALCERHHRLFHEKYGFGTQDFRDNTIKFIEENVENRCG